MSQFSSIDVLICGVGVVVSGAEVSALAPYLARVGVAAKPS